MPDLKVHPNGDGIWPDLAGRKVHHVTSGIEIARLPGGMSSGKSSVSIRINLPNGEVVLAETSLALFLSASQLFTAREKIKDHVP